ncbi:FAD-dependent monooxygenase [Fortiea sp. LEGE XX443]|uniref:FAD-dependent monooxygenase n=1 Tax=Fortiea sp. LEGE XX443 TaxID=1828611 RepID=UPI001880081E|nr:FAD-dependent monooxygenase [Fortiea sp. LEGE XX443]MBE9006918.1 FAD-dependent monooxygenase [Fortiea sp. LEGE XX443]
MIKKVAIVGAGLGGLTVAIALHKKGINAQVYEKASFLRPIGAGLSIVPNGLHCLEAIVPGITDLLKQAGSETRMLTLKKSTGEIIAQKSVNLIDKYSQPMLQIRWSRLQEILASALPTENIHLNYRCINFEQNDKSIKVYFDGNKTVEVELLIGADGLNSAVRQTMIGDGEPRYAGRMSWRAVLQYSHEMLHPDEVMSMTAPDGKIFGFFDLGGGYIMWSAAALSPGKPLKQSASDIKSYVQEKFANWAEPVQAIIKATNAEDIIERPICDRPPLSNWSQGRVTLLGDAAHPMVPLLGQGANTAFEDAWELSQFLCHAPNLATALACYEKSRQPRTQIIQIRNAVQANRAYKADSEVYLRGMMEKAQVSDREFEEWLYGYNPSLATCG